MADGSRAVMPSVTSGAGPIHVGMDTSKNTIVAGILMPGQEIPVVDRIWNEEGSVRHRSDGWVIRPRCGAVMRPGRAGSTSPA